VKVTELGVQKKNPSRFNLYLDGNFVCGISTTSVAKWGIYKGKVIDEPLIKEILNDELYLRFLDRTVSYISSSIKTERSVRVYLKNLHYKKKGDWFDEDIDVDFDSIFERVITQLKKTGYIDDRRYAELFLNSRVNYKPRSKEVIFAELISKGLDRAVAREVVNDSGVDNSQLIKDVYRKKFKEEKFDVEDSKKVDFLRRKGFNWDDISKLEIDLKNDSGE